MDENMTTAVYIPTVIEREPCAQHGAELNEPCWIIDGSRRGIKRAICSNRATRAAYNGNISDQALRRNYVGRR